MKNTKKLYKNNKFKISALTWNKNFELSDVSYSVSDIQDCFEYILKSMKKSMKNNPSIRILNKNFFNKKQKMQLHLESLQGIFSNF